MENVQQLESCENKPMGIGYRLKLLRKTLNLKAEDFALSVGATSLTLSKWEKNESVPRTNFIQVIVKKYNVNKKWLEWGVGEMFATNEELDENDANASPTDKQSVKELQKDSQEQSVSTDLLCKRQQEDFKNTPPYDFAMEQGCGEAASSFFAAFCNMNEQQKKIVIDSFRAVVNVFQDAQNADAEIELDKNSVAITEPQKLADDESQPAEETIKRETPQKKKRQEPWKGRILAAKARQKR